MLSFPKAFSLIKPSLSPIQCIPLSRAISQPTSVGKAWSFISFSRLYHGVVSFPPSRRDPLATGLVFQKRHLQKHASHSPPLPNQYAFDEISKISSTNSSQSNSAKQILIDVRTPMEVRSTGIIPSAKHVPLTSLLGQQSDYDTDGTGHFPDPEDFEATYGFARPSEDTEMIFYCLKGIRAKTAADIAARQGWTKVGVYEGSWADWDSRGGEREQV